MSHCPCSQNTTKIEFALLHSCSLQYVHVPWQDFELRIAQDVLAQCSVKETQYMGECEGEGDHCRHGQRLQNCICELFFWCKVYCRPTNSWWFSMLIYIAVQTVVKRVVISSYMVWNTLQTSRCLSIRNPWRSLVSISDNHVGKVFPVHFPKVRPNTSQFLYKRHIGDHSSALRAPDALWQVHYDS